MTAGWCVRVSVFDELIVSISERELCGRDLSAADQDLIRGCAQHLLSFVGPSHGAPLAVAAVARIAGSDPEPTPRESQSSVFPAVSAAPSPAEETTVLQAVLDAITGTLDPRSQIADHPNVKFAQLERLKWLQGANVATAAPPPAELQDLIRRVVTGDGAQLENLDLTDAEWHALGEDMHGADYVEHFEVTMRFDDWLAMVRVARADRPSVSTSDGPLHICQQPGFDPRLHRCLGCHP